MRGLRLLLAVGALAAAADAVDATRNDATFVIDAATKLHDVFKCAPLRPIGIYNEYFVACAFTPPPPLNASTLAALHVRDVVLDGALLAPDVPLHVHVELELALGGALAAVTLANCSVRASAVSIRAASVALLTGASVNVSARGLKFGPGFNSRAAMGGSYGGVGGASLSLLRQSCAHVRANEFFRAIGDVAGGAGDFQGYGSGGGNDHARGGGRVSLVATQDVVVDGAVLANGGPACSDCSDAAGAGGTVRIKAGGRLSGAGVVQANGGEPALFDSAAFLGAGGGGGGGGGRVVLESKSAEELDPSNVEAFGGGRPPPLREAGDNDVIQWCQLGGDGTILKTQHAVQRDGFDDEDEPAPPSIGTLVVKGGRLAHEGPAKRIQIFGCTPIYDAASSWQAFLPDNVAHVFVSGGATVCASYVKLPAKVAGILSSIVLDAGSQVNALEGNRSVHLVASQLTLQGFVGPSTQSERDLFRLKLEGGDVSVSNGLLLVELLDVAAAGSLAFDKYSVAKFRVGITAHSGRESTIAGFLEPLEPPSFEADAAWAPTSIRASWDDDTAFVRLESQGNVTLLPQPAQFGALSIAVVAGDTAVVDIPFDTPFVRLSVAAKNATVPHFSSGPLRQCDPIQQQADADTCKTLRPSSVSSSSAAASRQRDTSPYGVSVFATQVAWMGNISAGSILLCSDDVVTVRSAVSARALGCGSGSGPGNSSVVGGASGGAGHGGRGGNVEPGNTGGGAAYDGGGSLWATLSPSDPDFIRSDEGKWPLWPGSGASSGDTSEQIVGGRGGGVVYVGAKTLEVLKAAVLSVRGGDGSKRGGGGAGGSMALFVHELAGGGVVDLDGGDAVNPSTSVGAPTDAAAMARESVWRSDVRPLDAVDDEAKKIGGGGGGGVVRVTYRQSKDSSSNGEQFVKDGGKLSVRGGASVGGDAGAAGVMAAANCEAGRGDVFCLQCAAGSYSPDALSRCIPCEPGSCSNRTGAASCDTCSLGTFNADFGKRECAQCPAGHFAAATGAKACAPCGPGRFAAGTGSAACALCPVGTVSVLPGSANCTVCGVGETTTAPGSVTCTACRDKPAHSQFNVRGNCTYACDKGRNGLDCLTPFERLVKPVGGPLGFVVLVFSLTGLLFGTWGFLSYRSSQHQQRRFAEYKAQTLRDQLSLANLTRKLTPRLTDQDLDAHLARLYFSGDNHVESSWRLNASYLPLAMREIVYEGQYLSFAAKCNELLRWDPTGWEAWGYRLLLCSVPPLGTLFKRRRQLRRVEKLAKFVEDHGAGFFREMNFRVHGAKLKIGFSPDFSLAYIDVLVPSGGSVLSLLDTRHVGSLTLVVAGSGSFFRPFHIDTNDIFVRAVPSRLELLQHSFWIDFVADLNRQLRVIPQPASRALSASCARAVRDLLSFVDAFNARHDSDGFAVAFGYFSVDAAVRAESNDACFARWEPDRVDDVLEQSIDEPFKFAFQVSKHWESDETRRSGSRRSVGHEGGGEEDSLAPSHYASRRRLSRESSLKTDDDPRPAEFRFSQIRMEALFADTGGASLASPRDGDGNGGGAVAHSLLSPTSKKRRRGSPTAAATNALAALVSRDALRRVFAVLQPLSPLFGLYNVPPPSSARPRLLPAVLLALLVADAALVFWVLMEYYCVQVEDPTAADSGCSRAALLSVLWILPLAIVGAPGLGLVFLAKKSVFYGKLFGVWTVGAIVNALVAFVCGLVYFPFIHDGVLAIAVALVATKYAEKQVALRCIAQFACERPLRGWRGLYTTKDWYDSAYTPLAHQEN
ncbi:hypothetical protein PybrP1_009980 [[Pythium] brassicae (nom. inval.)]|nr:hypothetical protein PybrP1_009980 [[Pythium] brassicae (nom. inval.)]